MTTQEMYDKVQFSGYCETLRFGKYDLTFLPFRNHTLGSEHCLIDVYRENGAAEVLVGTLLVRYPFRGGEPVEGFGLSGTGRSAATLQEAIDALERAFYA